MKPKLDDNKTFAILTDTTKCTGCETCVQACPSEAIKMVDGVAKISADDCTECGTCVGECPSEAIKQQ